MRRRAHNRHSFVPNVMDSSNGFRCSQHVCHVHICSHWVHTGGFAGLLLVVSIDLVRDMAVESPETRRLA